MDYGIPQEFLELKELTRRFVERELRPHEEEVEKADAFPDELRSSLRKRAVELGLHAFNMPVEVGGPGLPYLAQVVIREELGKVSVALADAVGRPPRLLTFCNDEQKERFLFPAMRAEKTWAFALTEPQAGSDAASLRTRATATEGGYLLRGTKHFISHGNNADFVAVVARVAEEGDPLATFLVERGTKGMSTGRVHPKMGWRGYPLAEVIFDDAFVPAANLVGEHGQGLRLAMSHIGEARIGVAAHCVGMAQRALDVALEHAGTRVQFGRPIGQFQGLQWMLAEMALEVEQSRAMVYAAARAMDNGADARVAVSMAKLSASEMACRVADRALQILGGSGYVAETPVEMIFRDARAFRIGEGTSEMQKNQIARALLGKELFAR